MGMKIYCYRICFASCILISLTSIIVVTFFLEGLIKEQVLDGVKMTNDNYDIWGDIPGKIGISPSRNLSLFNFTNPK